MREIAKNTIEMAGRGDIYAFEEIYKQYSSTVYTIALGITRNHQNAEEATQDVFFKIYRGINTFRFGSSFGTWLYRITVNTAINVYNKNARRDVNTLPYDELKDARMVTAEIRKETADKQDATARVAMLMDNISPEHRSCIILREIEGLDYKEMANVLSIPINTVRSRLKRARESLIAYCRKEGIRYEL
ncbi:MAG: sigma-70 family RNA polymerase sigma factor [Candidatus Omnitrophota bacterium]|nr:sigma-70 family RNA polymerase sigma factor [Candidatus Omnitrophota bacterium]